MNPDYPFVLQHETDRAQSFRTLADAVDWGESVASGTGPAIVSHTGTVCAICYGPDKTTYTHHASRVSHDVPAGATLGLP